MTRFLLTSMCRLGFGAGLPRLRRGCHCDWVGVLGLLLGDLGIAAACPRPSERQRPIEPIPTDNSLTVSSLEDLHPTGNFTHNQLLQCVR
jgi:hypothetical protein